MIRRWMLTGAAVLFAASPALAQSDAGAARQSDAGAARQSDAGAARQSDAGAARQSSGAATRQAGADAAQGPVDDALFAAAAAESGAFEVAMSRLGVEKATDPQLKQFGQMMVEEHTKMNEELATLAAAKGIQLPREVGVCPRFKLQSLAGLSGAEFDKCFAEAQLVAHKEAKGIFEAQAKRGRDPEVKALAAKGLQHIMSHLETIKPIAMKYENAERSGHAGQPGHADDGPQGQPAQRSSDQGQPSNNQPSQSDQGQTSQPGSSSNPR
jgi:putative membrane protein